MTAERPTGLLLRGYDEQIGVEVALRIIDAGLLVDEGERRQFVQRATRAKSLQHPNLIRLYDVVVDDETVFLVMQWAPGERLSRRLAAGSLPLGEARLVLRRAAAGIAHAHQHGVVLGNVRADTVLLYPDGLKLTNVGIGPALPRQRFLAAMAQKGALEMLAPELRAGLPPDERSDVYALAALARTLLLPGGQAGGQAGGEPSAAEVVRPLLERTLASTPGTRMRDAEAFARELESTLDGKSVSGRGPVRSVPTGSDTERVSKMDLLDLVATEERASLEPREAAAELKLELHTRTNEALTLARRPREKGDVISPGATNVGHRSAAQIPKPLDSGGLGASPPHRTGPCSPLPSSRHQSSRRPSCPRWSLRRSQPSRLHRRRRRARCRIGAASRPSTRSRRTRPGASRASIPARLRGTRRNRSSQNLPVTAEYEPGLARTKSGQRRTIALLSICGVGIGAIGAVALWHYATPTPQIARTAITSPSPTPIPTPLPTPTPTATPTPIPTPIPTPHRDADTRCNWAMPARDGAALHPSPLLHRLLRVSRWAHHPAHPGQPRRCRADLRQPWAPSLHRCRMGTGLSRSIRRQLSVRAQVRLAGLQHRGKSWSSDI